MRPARIQSSTSRRDAKPARESTFWRRSPSSPRSPRPRTSPGAKSEPPLAATPGSSRATPPRG
jgi:hypothetical protein